MALSTGTRLGPYEILAAVGAGGMGEVYRACDTRLNRIVAIKVLLPHFTSEPDSKHRFDREARAIAALSHPHICSIFDVGHQNGTDFLVMEFLEGETLAARLRRGRPAIDQAIRCAIEIAYALDKAHRQGIVHRGLTPGRKFTLVGTIIHRYIDILESFAAMNIGSLRTKLWVAQRKVGYKLSLLTSVIRASLTVTGVLAVLALCVSLGTFYYNFVPIRNVTVTVTEFTILTDGQIIVRLALSNTGNRQAALAGANLQFWDTRSNLWSVIPSGTLLFEPVAIEPKKVSLVTVSGVYEEEDLNEIGSEIKDADAGQERSAPIALSMHAMDDTGEIFRSRRLVGRIGFRKFANSIRRTGGATYNRAIPLLSDESEDHTFLMGKGYR
jgi:hypothetical protein